ncbi:hypothetical protein SH203_02493 [Brevundimonas sp. SH203]|nr:hypothetical protein SH203_02493 [Brevundimonas sp. SH203]
MHVGILTTDRTVHNLPLSEAAFRMAPAALENIEQALRFIEQTGFLKKTSRSGKAKQNKRLIIQIGTFIKHITIMGEFVNKEAILPPR